MGSIHSSKLHHSPFLCRSQVPCSQRQRLHASTHYRGHDWTQAWRIFLHSQTFHLSLHQKQIKKEDSKWTTCVSRQRHGCNMFYIEKGKGNMILLWSIIHNERDSLWFNIFVFKFNQDLPGLNSAALTYMDILDSTDT